MFDCGRACMDCPVYQAGMPCTYSLCEINVGLAPNSLRISPGHSITTSDSVVPSRCVRACVLNQYSRVRLFGTRWTGVHQALLSIGFSRQEYWSGLPCPPAGGSCHNISKYYLWSSYVTKSLYYVNPLQYSCLENPMDRGAW